MTSPTPATTLGSALRLLRVRAGLTQAQLADRAAFNATYLSRVENGERDLRWSSVMRLVQAAGADLYGLADAIVEVEREHQRRARPPHR